MARSYIRLLSCYFFLSASFLGAMKHDGISERVQRFSEKIEKLRGFLPELSDLQLTELQKAIQ